MDLFVINRYKDSEEDLNLAKQELINLEKLRQKIKERKHLKDKKLDTVIKQSVEEDNLEENQKFATINEENLIAATETVQSKETEIAVKDKTEFKILGISNFKQRDKVKRILPYWLSHPYSIPTNLRNLACPVQDLTWLHSTLKSTLLNEGVNHLFPVQENVIPFILEQHSSSQLFWPHDVCVSAPTGSGKTLSFVLPIIQILMNEVGCHVRALVVLPVQELAAQVAKVFRKYCTKTGLKVALLSGSVPLRQEQRQIIKYTESLQWISEVDIIVCTAGRLVEHLQNTEGFSLKKLKFLVIDEADKIMDHIQNDWLYHLDRHIKLENDVMKGKISSVNWANINSKKPSPHKLLFSATLSQDPEKLDQWGLFQPKLFSAGVRTDYEDEDQIRKYTTPDELKESYVTCSAEEKPIVLYHFLIEKKWDKVLCFTNAAQSAHRLTVLLNTWGNGKIQVSELSATLDSATRETVLKQFTLSKINILISTDALARGIDVPDCRYVISYDPPRNIKTYIHRVGRTGRAGRIGQAVTILLENQLNMFKGVMQSGDRSALPRIEIDTKVIEQLSESYSHAMQKTKKIIKDEIISKVKKSITVKRGIKSKQISQKRKFSQKINHSKKRNKVQANLAKEKIQSNKKNS